MTNINKCGGVLIFEAHLRNRDNPALHSHEFHEFFYCLDGVGLQFVEGGAQKISAGELFFFPGGMKHIGSRSPESECHAFVLNFGNDIFFRGIKEDNEAAMIVDMLCGHSEKNPRVPLSKKGSAKIRSICKDLADEMKLRRPGVHCAIKANIQRFLIAVLRNGNFPSKMTGAFTGNAAAERIAAARALLERNFSQPLSVKDIAGQINMSRSHFHAEFLKQTGLTMTQYLNKTRVNAAAKLLRENKLPTETIALSCGFGSLSNFYRVLRMETGISPALQRTK